MEERRPRAARSGDVERKKKQRLVNDRDVREIVRASTPAPAVTTLIPCHGIDVWN
jgi:hypothetical protein